jgi:hypothetical protein
MNKESLMKRVSGSKDVPSIPHYAVIIYRTQSVYHEGDERSRTNPGHGYPAWTENIESFEHWVTDDLSNLESSNLESFILLLEDEKKVFHTDKVNYVVMKVNRLQTTLEVKVKLS